MGKFQNFIKNNVTLSVIITIGILVVVSIASGAIGNAIGKYKQKKPIELDFDSVNLRHIFDGFKTNVFNSTSGTNIYCEYDLDYFTSNYHDIGHFNWHNTIGDNCYMEGLEINNEYQSDCAFKDITFMLDSTNDIDYSKLNVVIYGDGEYIYSNSNINADFTITFDPYVIEITILVF
ncbi:MAG: hypothetical protein ACTSPI_02825 [Candidatus Heimdallarchaeaceae archaeon]